MNATGCMESIRRACPEITPARQETIENAALKAGVICAAGVGGGISGYLVKLCTGTGLLKTVGGGFAAGTCLACTGFVAEDVCLRCRNISVSSDDSPNRLPVANQPGKTTVLFSLPSIILTEPPYEESPFKKIN
ncbi:hypothetical protein [Endozoicomonas sp. ONNA2]|uniref:hypothetical protein n=1 Tax=Endozoicomonas sp. ONNA2 TaxID=2828741 RepID=UPI0021480967|nr:hypothetical protein [Endozoicomonas sp. ONNA2]